MASTPPVQRIPLRCTCCEREILAELVEDTLFIRASRHGREHVLLIKIDKIKTIRYDHPISDRIAATPE